MKVPEEPPIDTITTYLLNVFYNVCRGRRFVSNMSGVFPLPLSAREISDWLEAHPSPLPRRHVDEVVFALDSLCLNTEDE